MFSRRFLINVRQSIQNKFNNGMNDIFLKSFACSSMKFSTISSDQSITSLSILPLTNLKKEEKIHLLKSLLSTEIDMKTINNITKEEFDKVWHFWLSGDVQLLDSIDLSADNMKGLNDLESHFLHHNILITDLPQNKIYEMLKREEPPTSEEFTVLRNSLYDASFPIPLNGTEHDSEHVLCKRQYMIERLTYSRAILDTLSDLEEHPEKTVGTAEKPVNRTEIDSNKVWSQWAFDLIEPVKAQQSLIYPPGSVSELERTFMNGEVVKKTSKKKMELYIPPLELLPPEAIAVVASRTIISVFSRSASATSTDEEELNTISHDWRKSLSSKNTGVVTFTSAAVEIGEKIFEEIGIRLREGRFSPDLYDAWIGDISSGDTARHAACGAWLLDLLLKNAFIETTFDDGHSSVHEMASLDSLLLQSMEKEKAVHFDSAAFFAAKVREDAAAEGIKSLSEDELIERVRALDSSAGSYLKQRQVRLLAFKAKQRMRMSSRVRVDAILEEDEQNLINALEELMLKEISSASADNEEEEEDEEEEIKSITDGAGMNLNAKSNLLPVFQSRFNPAKVEVPAFTHFLSFSGNKKQGMLRINPLLFHLRASHVAHPPMVMTPQPWMDISSGPYLLLRSPLIRVQNSGKAALKKSMSSSQGLHAIMHRLNLINQQAWKINQDIFDVMLRGWNDLGGDFAGLPKNLQDTAQGNEGAMNKNKLVQLKRPKFQDYGKTQIVEFKESLDDWLKSCAEKEKLASSIPTFQLRLDVANNLKNASKFYIPHSIDFRGRCYPIPPHLNHQGEDYARSLFLFATPRALGVNGLRWLKIHVASLAGKDKISFEERVKWTDANLENMQHLLGRDSLTGNWIDPLEKNSLEFWTSQEDAWQFLAAVRELLRAYDHAGGPEEYLSCLPVHQDGSCNGLQHYAALGRDEVGAKAVNVSPSDFVQDVYSHVLDATVRQVNQHASSSPDSLNAANDIFSNPSEKSERELAQKCIDYGLLKRKTVKQTVMTICYGVTPLGAKLQVQRRIQELHPNMPLNEAGLLALYLSRIVLSSVDEVFSEARKIQNWFGELVNICNSLKMPISWTTPLGLIVEQPYRKSAAISVAGSIQRMTLYNDNSFDEANPRKQKLAMPPNFIHSLDATHLMLTSTRCLTGEDRDQFNNSNSNLQCNKCEPIAFAGVHDSYWTHAADVDRMSEVLRDEFVKMYSKPILEGFRDTLQKRIADSGVCLPNVPVQGKLDLESVKQAKYFFH